MTRAITKLVGLMTASVPFLLGASSDRTPVICVVDLQEAMLRTQEGHKREQELLGKYKARHSEIKKRQAELDALRDRLRNGRNLMSGESRSDLLFEIRRKMRSLEREIEDAQAELRQEEAQVTNEIGARMLSVITDYARSEGTSLVLNISQPGSAVLYASETIDMTDDVVTKYDQIHPE